jgi:hypothetical protein
MLTLACLKTTTIYILLMSSELTNVMDAIVNPIEHSIPCRMPDGPNFPTIPLIDYATDNNLTVDMGVIDPAPADSSAFIAWITVATPRYPSFGYYSTRIYNLAVVPLDSTGAPITASSGLVPVSYFSNYSQAYGPPNIAKSFRVLAGGLRLLPQVEVVTDTSSQYILKYHTACISNYDLARWFLGASTNLLSLFLTARSFKDYSNMQGVCVRYDSLQYDSQMKFYTPAEWLDPQIVNQDKWYSTCVYVQFRNAISPVLNAENSHYYYTYPVRYYTKVWLEAQLNEPTSIIAAMGSFDPNTAKTIESVRMNEVEYPCATHGHSFKSFMKGVKKVYNPASKALNIASKIMPIPGLQAMNTANQSLFKAINNNNVSPNSNNPILLPTQTMEIVRKRKNKNKPKKAKRKRGPLPRRGRQRIYIR